LKKSSIYTGFGDKGKTSLASGATISKTNPHVEAYGTIDELNTWIGLLVTEMEETGIVALLHWIQHKLFAIGAYMATDTTLSVLRNENRITSEHIARIEQEIDAFDSELPALHAFVLPGGCRANALANVCRTVCRRAEREIVRLYETISGDENTLIFINRLSDLLFVVARYANFQKKVDEIIWDNTCK